LKEKVTKRSKNRAVLSPHQFFFFLKLLAPPRVRFLLAQKLLGTAAHFYGLQIFYGLQTRKQDHKNISTQ
jgi:hypothetical protein